MHHRLGGKKKLVTGICDINNAKEPNQDAICSLTSPEKYSCLSNTTRHVHCHGRKSLCRWNFIYMDSNKLKQHRKQEVDKKNASNIK